MVVKTHKFSSGVFDISYMDTDGLCCPANTKQAKGEIIVHTDLTPKDELETWVHEALHAEFPAMSEDRVTAAGHNIARLLWRLGYRKTGK